jgi:acyl-coenzyme A thioesterase PaaI-like protein
VDQFQSTLKLHVHFLRPVRPGRVFGKGRVVHRDGDLAFLEASLPDSQGTLVATATATARVIALIPSGTTCDTGEADSAG